MIQGGHGGTGLRAEAEAACPGAPALETTP